MIFSCRYRILLLGLILLLTVLFPSTSSNADAIAPTYLEFHLHFNIENTPILNAKLLLCTDKSCNHYEQYNKGELYCTNDYCIVYPSDPDDYFVKNFADFNKIIFSFTDKPRESNVFPFHGKVEQYDVQIDKDNLIVGPHLISLSSFVEPTCFTYAAFLTIVVEILVAAIYTKKIKDNIPILLLVAIANIFSLPVVWFIFRSIISNDIIYWSLSEIFAVIFEAAFLFLFGRKYGISMKQASILSLVMNVASFLAGLLMVFSLSFLT